MSVSIRIVSSMATRAMLTELLGAYEGRTRQRVSLEASGGVEVARRVRSGESFDGVVLARDTLDELMASGYLVVGSAVDLVRSSVAVAVRAQAPRPEVGREVRSEVASEAGLRRAVLAARSIGYSTGPSGRELAALFQRWGIEEQVRERITVAAPGVPVASLVASGQVELGFQQLSELLGVEGIEVLGPLPEPIQITTVFAAAIGATAQDPEGVREVLRFLSSPDAADVKRRHGMDPINSGEREQ